MLQAALALLAEADRHGADFEPALFRRAMLGQPLNLPPRSAFFRAGGGLQVVQCQNLALVTASAQLGEVVSKSIGVNDAAAEAMHGINRGELWMMLSGTYSHASEGL